MASTNAATRQQAVWSLRDIGGEKALALLRKALADPDLSVGIAAVGVLGSEAGGEESMSGEVR